MRSAGTPGGAKNAGDLELVLNDNEPPPCPVHLIAPQGRLSVPKVRAFVDFLHAHVPKAVSGGGRRA